MRLFIAGKNNIAVDVLNYAIKNLDIPISVILNKTENYKNGFQKSLGFYAKLWEIPVVNLEEVYKYSDAIFLSLEFDQIIKPNLFNTNALYNIHFSLLPAYKGMFTSSLPLINGENKSGVTLHKIDAGIDTGDIIAQKEFKIENKDTARELYLKYINYGTTLIIENLVTLLNVNYKSTPQIANGSTYFGKNSIDYTNLKIDYKQTAFQIINQLRAFSFREYQLPKFKNYEIGSWEITKRKSNLKSGSIVKEMENRFQIATIDFDIILTLDPYSSLWKYCKKNEYQSLEKLLKHEKIDLEIKTKEGWTALIIAVYNNSFECVKLLIDKGANVNAYNYNFTNVLMYAKTNMIKTFNKNPIKILIKNGADIKATDIYGKTVLDWAKEEDNDVYQFIKSFI